MQNNLIEYKVGLQKFNTTDKYLTEVGFLTHLLSVNEAEDVLDYGCGIGTMINHLQQNTLGCIYGFDVNDFFDGNPPANIRMSYDRKFDKIYFMHSFAHIPHIAHELENIKKLCYPHTQLFILTPNKIWLDFQDKTNYKPDQTVVEHFCSRGLKELFENRGFKIIMQGQFGKECNGQHERLWINVTL